VDKTSDNSADKQDAQDNGGETAKVRPASGLKLRGREGFNMDLQDAQDKRNGWLAGGELKRPRDIYIDIQDRQDKLQRKNPSWLVLLR
jgi:hypothetical protein